MLHIKRIEIKDWLGIKELNVSPGKINKVDGDSGAGKTSLIEGLEKALTNNSRRTEVISHGQEEAELFVELTDGLQITRKVRAEKADYLKVKHDSKAVNSTEGFLRKLINGEIFRPIEFVQKDVKEQTKIILNMLQIDWTVEDIKSWFGEMPEADYQLHILQILQQIESAYFEERSSINREINLLRANIEGIKRDLPPNYDGEIWRGVNLQELYRKLSNAEDANKRLEEAQRLVDSLALRMDDIRQRAATVREGKRLEYKRQRDSLHTSISVIIRTIEDEQAKIDAVDRRISDEHIRLDNQLQQEIERLKAQFTAKKQVAKDTIQQEADQSRAFISEYQSQLSEAGTKLGNVEALERKDIERIDEYEQQQIELEQTKTGNAQQVVAETEWSDPAPLKAAADEATQMKEFLREWERMNDIIREKLAPKEARAADLTAKIEKARELPKELLKTAALPVDGLTVDDKGRIRINDTLIDGLSEGEALDFAFKLAKAQSGPLKVICIDGYQNLGSKQQEILESAQHDDYQYFLLSTVKGKDLEIETLEG
ncbi:ATP-binding protein [Paenibacillus graminis]|uniref:Rad50/SbcC-type AAA domain-containing protein n=1 Tax=Paenibacillus graminis TaxID=189425 RepID=A0A089MDF9_9BACL|nr:ATP-binding protein [Paenibacillus graminis]AIQ69503.1 hypothetical protein PGRAT_19050 [Paenibacillus graminis]